MAWEFVCLYVQPIRLCHVIWIIDSTLVLVFYSSLPLYFNKAPTQFNGGEGSLFPRRTLKNQSFRRQAPATQCFLSIATPGFSVVAYSFRHRSHIRNCQRIPVTCLTLSSFTTTADLCLSSRQCGQCFVRPASAERPFSQRRPLEPV